MTEVATALFVILLVLGLLDALEVIDDSAPKWLRVLARFAAVLSVVPGAFVLARLLGEGSRVIDESTAGEQAQDELDDVDEDTKDAIQDADTDRPSDESAAAAESELHDAADDLGLSAPDDGGFSGDADGQWEPEKWDPPE
ncbi:MAG: hypothetical protein U5L04_02365 [Trueperaceae bacterium]|nr:hypothetical protein [Trueperaceae bacterium]